MRTRGSRFGVLVAALLVSGRAFAGDPSLMVAAEMVAAEIDPGLGVDARAVREAIGAELHRKIEAPAAEPDAALADVLVVAMTRERIVVSFRGHTEDGAARAIRTPVERAARLHAVAWLAGNLARDQVSPLVMKAAAQTPVPSGAVTEAPGPPAATTAPPDVATPPSDTAPAASNVLTRRQEDVPDATTTAPTWIFSVAGGSGITDERGWGGQPVGFAPAWQAEAQHRLASGWLFGGAIDYGPTPAHRLGYAVTETLQQRWRAFGLEESLGLGLESGVPGVPTTTVINSGLTGQTSQTTTVSSTTAAYLRAFVTAVHPLWRSWDVVLRVGAHSDLGPTLRTAYLATSLGVRLSLP